ncbi:MAG: preprotein translocase subunit SecA [Gammaproteobacteria bacterium]|nr:preprotein translocase subunit SecA [Gammaproteobacteria bacterium]
MLQHALKRVFGDRNQRLLKKLGKTVDRINALEAGMSALDDQALAAKTGQLRARIGEGARRDDLLVEAFAVVREASVRTLGLRHFDVQLVGGAVLNSGRIAEMKTGEGKTLVATLPAYLNAVAGVPVHIVTVNDYLARRDAEWMGAIYRFLGLQVGVIVPGQDPEEKRAAYRCDIVYGTNNEFGFDYLRDNMAFTAAERFQRGLGFAIVDEVDSILIDEARTPLIISGPAEESTHLYTRIDKIAPRLTRQESEDRPGDFTVDEKTRQVYLTEQGYEKAEKFLVDDDLLPEGGSLYEIGNISLVHHLYAALRAHHLFHKDVAYIVRDGQVVIIDEFTGRMMVGRRWSDGLHQAVEAREGVAIQQENQTLASITFQNYFRLYETLAGMTGTADTEAPEFLQIYNLEVVIIPTNRPMIRRDDADQVYRTAEEKFTAIIDGIAQCRARSQPVLVGTASIESSERLSAMLRRAGIDHQVLNAKHHDREAQIIAEAGRPGTVTIATNMAGRGTDIVLGGNLELELAGLADDAHQATAKEAWEQRHRRVIEAGGLHVLGTERNESRRVDNQLRGRCGRQGDPGSSQFYLSLEDNLMRIFGSERIAGLMQKLGMEEGEAIEHPWVTRAIENAQTKVEGHNFDARKQLLEYDDVANEQRKVIYRQRDMLMETDDIADTIAEMRGEVLAGVIDRGIPPGSMEEQWDVAALEHELETELGVKMPLAEWLERDHSLHEETLRRKIEQAIADMMTAKEARVGAENMRHFEKAVMLKVLDEQWKEHLFNMDHLRQGIHLRGYAQKNPKQEYKREAFEMFTALMENVKFEVTSLLARLHIPNEEEIREMEARRRRQSMRFIHAEAEAPTADADTAATPPAPPGAPSSLSQPSQPSQPFVRTGKKIGRNEPCPCGSGKKFKQCHGKI